MKAFNQTKGGRGLEPFFDEYINLYSGELTRFCISLCGNKADADDLFQETWYKAMKNYDKYNDAYPFEKWLLAICANCFKDFKRLSHNKRIVGFQNESEENLFFDSLPDINSEKRFDYVELHCAVAALPNKFKVVLTLYYFKDYSIKEISEILSLAEGTVKSRLRKAKSVLKRRLTDENY